MKQRGTDQSGTKRPTNRARATDTVPDPAQNSTGRKVQNRTANGTSVLVAQAARILGVERRTIWRMCDEGSLPFFTTPGGHRRIALADIEEKTESKLSLMPEGLLVTLDKDEILDLLAYVMSAGDSQNAIFTGAGH